MKKLLSLSILIFGLAIGYAHATILQIEPGTGLLTGATGVLVDGTLYDVSFQDGTCNSVLSGCAPEDLVFQSGASALAASQALLDQVFLGENLGDPSLGGFFDSQPGLTRGCPLGAYNVCLAITPYGFLNGAELLYGIATNYGTSSGQTDLASLGGFNVTFDTSNDGIEVFAVWSLSHVSPVPEPSTYSMLLAGLGLIGFMVRKKQIITA